MFGNAFHGETREHEAAANEGPECGHEPLPLRSTAESPAPALSTSSAAIRFIRLRRLPQKTIVLARLEAHVGGVFPR